MAQAVPVMAPVPAVAVAATRRFDAASRRLLDPTDRRFLDAAHRRFGNARIAADLVAAAATAVSPAMPAAAAAPAPTPVEAFAAVEVLLVAVPQVIHAGRRIVAGVRCVDVAVVASPDVPGGLPVVDRRVRADALRRRGRSRFGLRERGWPDVATTRARCRLSGAQRF